MAHLMVRDTGFPEKVIKGSFFFLAIKQQSLYTMKNNLYFIPSSQGILMGYLTQNSQRMNSLSTQSQWKQSNTYYVVISQHKLNLILRNLREQIIPIVDDPGEKPDWQSIYTVSTDLKYYERVRARLHLVQWCWRLAELADQSYLSNVDGALCLWASYPRSQSTVDWKGASALNIC